MLITSNIRTFVWFYNDGVFGCFNSYGMLTFQSCCCNDITFHIGNSLMISNRTIIILACRMKCSGSYNQFCISREILLKCKIDTRMFTIGTKINQSEIFISRIRCLMAIFFRITSRLLQILIFIPNNRA